MTIGASPGIVTKQWGQPFVQDAFPLDPAHSMALTRCTFHELLTPKSAILKRKDVTYQYRCKSGREIDVAEKNSLIEAS
jgi:hypothetical protein